MPDDELSQTRASESAPESAAPTNTSSGKKRDRAATFTPSAIISEVDGSRQLVLEVAGVARGRKAIEAVHVSASGMQITLPGQSGTYSRITEDGSQVEFRVEFPLEGGKREHWDGPGPVYDVEIRVVESTGESFRHRDRRSASLPTIEPLNHGRLIQAGYFLFWNGKHENWLDRYRVPVEPVLGNYSSRNPEIIHHHIKWCVEHGINWLRIVWNPPNERGDGVDDVLRNHVLKTRAADHVAFSLSYNLPFWLYGDEEHQSLTTDLDREATRQRLENDLSYMAEEYFHRANYLHLDGRPVVTMVNANHYLGDISAAMNSVAETIGVRPYLIAELHGTSLTTVDFPFIEAADAVTGQPYTNRREYQTQYPEVVSKTYAYWESGTAAGGAKFLPTTTPGYRDVLRASPQRYAKLSRIARRHMGAMNAARIRAFNPWPELSVIEPYESVGQTLLDISEETLATGELPTHKPAEGTKVTLTYTDFERSGSTVIERNTLLWCKHLAFLDGNDKTLVSYDVGTFDEPHFVFGTLAPPVRPGEGLTRRFGGAFDKTTFLVEPDLTATSTLEIEGSVPNPLGIEVQIDGQSVAETTLQPDSTVHRIVFT